MNQYHEEVAFNLGNPVFDAYSKSLILADTPLNKEAFEKNLHEEGLAVFLARSNSGIFLQDFCNKDYEVCLLKLTGGLLFVVYDPLQYCKNDYDILPEHFSEYVFIVKNEDCSYEVLESVCN